MRRQHGRGLWAWGVGAVVLLGGCAHRFVELEPAPGAARVAGNAYAAEASVAGVRLVVDGDAWRGVPEQLTQVVPVRLTVENRSERPVALSYGRFALVGPEGTRYAALPPLQIEGTELQEVAVLVPRRPYPYFWYDRFSVWPHYAPYYPHHRRLGRWYRPFRYPANYYTSAYALWPVELPSPDMRAAALPEGVVEPGGTVSGFLYFQDVPNRVEQVRFTAELMDAETEARLGAVEIPFLNRGG